MTKNFNGGGPEIGTSEKQEQSISFDPFSYRLVSHVTVTSTTLYRTYKIGHEDEGVLKKRETHLLNFSLLNLLVHNKKNLFIPKQYFYLL